ncbi:hypothetical protein B0H13DRAFT_1925983 [Mycena leptocephala]|nr:hypothetical protein B0H13DRAFT_1925983 [Mycena leptocephala]
MRTPEELVPLPPKNLPANPQLRRIAATAVPSTKPALNRQQFCAVTGSAAASLEACHILNAVRKKKTESKEQAKERKREYVCSEAYLTELGLRGGAPFSLNSVFNEVLRHPPYIYPSGPSSAALPVWHQYVYNEQTGQLCSAQGHLILRLWSDAVSTIAVFSMQASSFLMRSPPLRHSRGWLGCPVCVAALDAQVKEFLQQLYFSPPTATAARTEEEDYEVLTPRSSADPRDEPGDDTEGDRDYNMDQDDGQDQDPTVQPKGGNANYERTPQEALKTDITDDLEDDLEE